MRFLLLGKYGQLGWELHRTLYCLGEVAAFDFPEIDLTNPDSFTPIIRELCPTIVINATAYTAVDRAESEPETAMALNGKAPGILADMALAFKAAFIHYSTDYVFDGVKGSPYTETDQPNPVNIYGRSKLSGEEAVQQVGGNYLILRTSWVYSLRRESFVSKVLRWSRQNPTLRIVSDQVSNPTWARALAEATAQMLARGSADSRDRLVNWIGERRGLYHLAGEGYASRLQWAQAILKYDPHKEEQVCKEILPASSEEFPTPAQRPAFSALRCDHFVETFGLRLPHWESSLQLAMET